MSHQLLQRKSVSHLELFFDLVFVFAFTEVTFYLSQDLTWLGLIRTVLILSTLWLAWQSYVWLGTTIDINDKLTKISLFVVMFAMVLSGLAVPFAFEKGAILFCSTNIFIRLFQVVLFIISKDKNLQEKKGYLELLLCILGSVYHFDRCNIGI